MFDDREKRGGLIPSALSVLAIALSVFRSQAPIQAPKEVVRTTWPDGKTKSEREVAPDGRGGVWNDGSYREWHANGQLAAEGGYSKGAKAGAWKTWHANAQIGSEGRYAKDRRTGKWTFWNDAGVEIFELCGKHEYGRETCLDGRSFAEGYRVDGRRQGDWTFWWDEGVRLCDARYRNGLRDGDWIAWDRDGRYSKLVLSGRYDGGRWVAELPDERIAKAVQAASAQRANASRASGSGDARTAGSGERRPAFDFAARTGAYRDEDLLAIAAVLDSLALTTKPDRDRALEIEPYLIAAANRHHFGHPPGDEHWSAERAREVTAAWSMLIALTAGDAAFWNLDTLEPFDVRSTSPSTLLRAPPLLADERLGGSQRGLQLPLYRARFEPQLGAGGKRDKAVAPAVADALAWLAAHQSADGSWDGDGFVNACGRLGPETCDGPGAKYVDVGLTGLALLAFLGDGHTPTRGTYAANVAHGLRWLIQRQDPDTGLIGEPFGNAFGYSHAAATCALAEACAFTDHPRLRAALEPAVAFILRMRNPYSAWRYAMPPDGNNDTSATAWMVCALHAAQSAGVAVPPDAFQGALAWIEEVTDPVTGRCGYDSIGSVSARSPRVNDHFPADRGEAMSAAALLCRYWIGQRPATSEVLRRHADLLTAKLPRYTADEPHNDVYYWYFGSHALRLFGGKQHWERWWRPMSAAALDGQRKDGDAKGSWSPQHDAWGWIGGRVYTTAMFALCLEAPYRFTPEP